MKIEKKIQNIAKNVLLIEAEAIRKLAEFINDDFIQSVQEILQSKGRIVVSGIGKSAIIANKLVATLNSTGTPSIFLHAADAIHGDIGMLRKEDVAICISKSGNTPEIKVLVPLLKRRGSKLIAMLGNKQSFLAEQADYILNCSVEKEACPHNLAPTTSTSAAIAMGDALAVALLEARGFDSTDFAKLHPGGALGKRLYLKVSDLYSMHDLPAVAEDADVKSIIVEISSKRLGATAVLDKDQKLCGIITDGDLRRMLEKHKDLHKLAARDIMTRKARTINHDEYAVKALQLMQDNNITQLVVLKESKVVGFVHLHDLLKEGLV